MRACARADVGWRKKNILNFVTTATKRQRRCHYSRNNNQWHMHVDVRISFSVSCVSRRHNSAAMLPTKYRRKVRLANTRELPFPAYDLARARQAHTYTRARAPSAHVCLRVHTRAYCTLTILSTIVVTTIRLTVKSRNKSSRIETAVGQ